MVAQDGIPRPPSVGGWFRVTENMTKLNILVNRSTCWSIRSKLWKNIGIRPVGHFLYQEVPMVGVFGMYTRREAIETYDKYISLGEQAQHNVRTQSNSLQRPAS